MLEETAYCNTCVARCSHWENKLALWSLVLPVTMETLAVMHPKTLGPIEYLCWARCFVAWNLSHRVLRSTLARVAEPENSLRVPDKMWVFVPEELGMVWSPERFSFPRRQRATVTLIVERGCCSLAVALHGLMARWVASPWSTTCLRSLSQICSSLIEAPVDISSNIPWILKSELRSREK